MKFLLLAAALILFSACNHSAKVLTKQQIAEQNLSEALKKTLNNPASYSVVSFGQLTPVSDSEAYAFQVNMYKGIVDGYKTSVVINEKMANLNHSKMFIDSTIINELNKSQPILDSFTNLFNRTKTFNGINHYAMVHKYRASNEYGGIVMNEHQFELDTALNVIMDNGMCRVMY